MKTYKFYADPGHAVAVVNGKIIDTFDNPAGKRVVAVFKKLEKFAE